MHRSIARLVVVVALLATGGLTERRAVAATAPPARVTVIGDSTLLGMRADGAARIAARYDLNLQAASCRRLIEVSCSIPFRPTNTIEVMRAQTGQLGSTVVIMAGYDDFEITAGVDVILAEARAQGVARVVWLTYMEDVTYTGLGGQTYAEVFRRHNAVLREKVAADPMLQLADWNAYADPHREWFSADGIHLSAAGSPALGTFIADSLDRAGADRCAAAAAGGAAVTAGMPAVPDGAGAGFHATSPTRLVDTRSAGGRPLGAGRQLEVDAAAVVGAGATAVAVNVTAAPACVTGYVTAYPCGGAPPLASNLNPGAGALVAGHAVVPLTAGARLFCLTALTQTDLVVDALGWYGPSGDGFTPVVPRRLLDTRAGAGAVAAGATVAVVTPASAGGAVALNVTMVEPAAAGFLTAYPADGAGRCDPAQRPLASAVNGAAGSVVANVVQVRAGGGGAVCIYSLASTHVVVDLAGTYGTGGTALHAVAPTRLLDTRAAGGSRLAGGAVARIVVPQPGARAAVLTLTGVGASASGYVTGWPADNTGTCVAPDRPVVSNLNVAGAAAVPNLAVVATGGAGAVCVFTQVALHLVVDQSAWFG